MIVRMRIFKVGVKKPVETYTVPDGSWVQTELLGAQHASFVTETQVTFKNNQGLVMLDPDPANPMPKSKYRLKFLQMIDTVTFSTATEKILKEFNYAFMADMRRILKPHIKKIEFHQNYYEINGFFETRAGHIFYFATGDLRFFAKHYGMLVRTVKDFKDYTGGPNMTVKYDGQFIDNLLAAMKAKGVITDRAGKKTVVPVR